MPPAAFSISKRALMESCAAEKDWACGPEGGMMPATLISVAETPGSSLQGLGRAPPFTSLKLVAPTLGIFVALDPPPPLLFVSLEHALSATTSAIVVRSATPP